jgi:hypothetical protein
MRFLSARNKWAPKELSKLYIIQTINCKKIIISNSNAIKLTGTRLSYNKNGVRVKMNNSFLFFFF